MTMDAQRMTRLIADMAEGEREFRNFAALRDALVPKLISGALRVSDAEALLAGGGP